MEWSPASPATAYGLSSGGPSSSAVTELSSVSAPSAGRADSPLHPDNPFMVLVVLSAVTFGLMAFSTSVRVGHTTASVSVGST